VHGCLATCLEIIHVQVIHIHGWVPSNQDEGHLAVNQRLNNGIIDENFGDHHAIHQPVVQDPCDHAPFVLRLCQPEHNRIIARVTDGGNSLEQLGEVGIGKDDRNACRDDHANHIGAPGCQPPGCQVGLEVVVIDHFQYLATGFIADIHVRINHP